MKTNILSSVILSCAVTFICAQPVNAKTFDGPEKCPGESAIAAVGIESVANIVGSIWAAGVMSNNYDTTDAWSFAVAGIYASDEDEAREKATESLSSLQYVAGPISIPIVDAWGCLYQTSQGYQAVTITPPLGLKASLRFVK